MSSSPKLTVGMPVYNGERFLAKALNALLKQTFTDFELIVSDNASTDRTEEICREYAAKDRRIRYLRNATNMGAGWNFRRVYELATGKYYKQAAHDDFCEPEFFETCIRALELDPGLTVAYTKTRVVDGNGTFLEDYECELRTDDTDPVIRFADLTLIGHRCFQIFGIHRKSALDQLPPQGSFAHADRVLLAQLGLMGRFYEAPQRLFVSTRHDGQSVWTMPTRVASRGVRLTRKVGTLPNIEWWDPNRSRAISFPECHAFSCYCQSIRRGPLSDLQKARAYAVMARWAVRYRRRLIGDFVLAADQLLWNWQSARAAGNRKLSEKELAINPKGGTSL